MNNIFSLYKWELYIFTNFPVSRDVTGKIFLSPPFCQMHAIETSVCFWWLQYFSFPQIISPFPINFFCIFNYFISWPFQRYVISVNFITIKTSLWKRFNFFFFSFELISNYNNKCNFYFASSFIYFLLLLIVLHTVNCK